MYRMVCHYISYNNWVVGQIMRRFCVMHTSLVIIFEWPLRGSMTQNCHSNLVFMSQTRANLLKNMARPERFELPTPWFVARYSIQLSYGRVDFWRRERDSNPRWDFSHTPLAGERLRPLGHLSVGWAEVYQLFFKRQL